MFRDVMKNGDVNVRSNQLNNRKRQRQLPIILASLAANALGAVIPIPGFAQLIGPLFVGGFHSFESWFQPREIPKPNMPPVITCPKSITRTQDYGRKSALVTWNDPMAYDFEDGELTNVILHGKKSGDRFSPGDEIIQYKVTDSEGRTDDCSFYVTVTVIKCEQVVPTDTLQANCQGSTYLGDSCSFTCVPGHTLNGASLLTCTSEGRYDKEYPTCEINTCPEPVLPDGGESWDCSQAHNFNSICYINCATGYQIRHQNSAFIKCQGDGTWVYKPSCKDVSAPTFTNCPAQMISQYADRGKNSTRVTWLEITASDNSDMAVHVAQTRGLSNGSPFEAGAHEISFEAVDSTGFKETCNFYINIAVRRCSAPKMTHPNLDINCGGQFTHGTACTVRCLQGIELKGAPRITCEAEGDVMKWKMPGGTPTCLEKKCPRLENPPNARLDCSEYTGGKICYTKCRRKYIPARNAKTTPSTCSPATGIWKNTNIPGCVKKRPPTAVKSNFLFYWKAECVYNDTENVTSTFEELLPKRNSGRRKCDKCRIENVRSACMPRRTYNIMAVRWAVAHDLTDVDDAAFLLNEVKGVGIRTSKWLNKHFLTLPLVSVGPTTPFKMKGSGNAVSCNTVYQANDAEQTCAACGAGYEYNHKDADCRPCPAGYYQDDSGDVRCIPCPAGRETIGSGKTQESDCKAPCPKGSSSRTGLTPCHDCSVGQYQTKERSTNCSRCPEGQITAATGSDKDTYCYNPATEVFRLSVLNQEADSIKLKWFRPAELHGVLLGYSISYYKSSENMTSSTSLNIQNNSTNWKTIAGLEPTTEYIFTIWAVTDKGKGLGRELRVSTLEQPETTSTIEPSTTVDPNLCPPGTNSPDGRLGDDGDCEQCIKGFYQDKAGQTGCLPCGAGLTTWYDGSISEVNCVDETWTTPSTTTTATTTTTGAPELCKGSRISKTGFKPGCRKCPKNKVPHKLRTRCIWCPKDGDNFVCTPSKKTKSQPQATTVQSQATTVQPQATTVQPHTTESSDSVLSPDDANRTDKELQKLAAQRGIA